MSLLFSSSEASEEMGDGREEDGGDVSVIIWAEGACEGLLLGAEGVSAGSASETGNYIYS